MKTYIFFIILAVIIVQLPANESTVKMKSPYCNPAVPQKVKINPAEQYLRYNALCIGEEKEVNGFTIDNSTPRIPQIEREAVIALYNSTNGDQWNNNTGWKTPPLHTDGFAVPGTEHTWVGLNVNLNSYRVRGINLPGNGLSGTLPPELGNLKALEKIIIRDKNLTGSIPPELGSLTQLKFMQITSCSLTGSIPTELGNLTNLTYLNLYENQLTGTIPSELGNLSKLVNMQLWGNELTGTIPPELGNLSALMVLYLNDNHLSGTIPPELGNLDRLQNFSAYWNRLTGTIPATMCDIPNIHSIHVSHNNLKGEIPACFKKHPNILAPGFLSIRYNGLYINDSTLLSKLITASPTHWRPWRNFQTLTPTNFYVSAIRGSYVQLKWTPIDFSECLGGYRVFYSTTPGGEYTYYGTTKDKTVSSMCVAGLEPETTYYFKLQARTEPMSGNQNTVDSDFTYTSATTHPTSDPLIVLSPNGNEELSADSVHEIRWSTTCTVGNVKIEYSIDNGQTWATVIASTDNDHLHPWTVPGVYSRQCLIRISKIDENSVDTSDAPFKIEYSSPKIPELERAALIALYNSTGGDNWTGNDGWKMPPLYTDGFAMPGTENTWHGITCNTDNKTVESINIGNNNLVGTLPPELGSLADLKYFYIGRNKQLAGIIPVELGLLINLEHLYLESNSLTGNIPAELGKLVNLKVLNLDRNHLTGSIPAELGKLVKLDTIIINANKLTGSIPKELGNLTNLKNLNMYNNNLTGSIPKELGNLTKIDQLVLSGNQLSGEIPPELGNLEEIVNFRLNDNRFTGSVPQELGYLENLVHLHVQGNLLRGQLPTTLKNLVNLRTDSPNIRYNSLYTDDEALASFLDTHIADWSNTQTIAPSNVSAAASTDNSITVSWTPILYTADTGGYRVFYGKKSGGPYNYYKTTTDKTVSSITVNNLEPETTYYFVIKTRTEPNVYNRNAVDSEYSKETSATTPGPPPGIPAVERAALIALYNNTNGDNWTDNSGWKKPPLYTDGFAMPGTAGTWKGVILNGTKTAVRGIKLDNNSLSGIIPPDLGNLSALTQLWLRKNRLTGTIPNELGKLGNLNVLGLNQNQLTGSIPVELASLTKLRYLALSGNRLTGAIPPEFGQSSSQSELSALYLGNNRLTGPIPPTLGNLSKLTALSIDQNTLTGGIPPELGNLSALRSLNLSRSHLTGTIPVQLGNLTKLTLLRLIGNNLTGKIPSELTNLAMLTNMDIGYNALHTNDTNIRTYLAQKDPDWENTQTIAPLNVTAVLQPDNTIKLTWSPIPFAGDVIRVFYAVVPGGPYTLYGTTTHRNITTMTINGLDSGKTFYFVIQTRTKPTLFYNNRFCDSEYSREVSVTTK